MTSGVVAGSSGFDWERAYASLDELRRSLQATDDSDGPAARRILEQRARELARREPEPEEPDDPLDVVVFAIGGERYAVPADCAQGAVPLRELTRVPHTPSCILGVVSHRGRILPVVDLRELAGTAGTPSAEPPWLLAVETRGIALGLAADEVAGIATIAAESVRPSSARADTFVKGVVDMVALLDVGTLARSPRITVEDEGS